MKEIELFYDPRAEVCKNTAVNEWIEMSEFESAFLCGLLRKRCPKKVLEVGVAGGGTTAVMLQCLDLLIENEVCEMYSVDLSKNFYRVPSRPTGFVASEIKTRIKPSIKHTFLLGDILPSWLDSIGNEIDFVVLDTMHILPGELLDFLAVLPYLTPDACVVLHDIAASHLWGNSSTYATQLLLDVVTAEKIVMVDQERAYHYPNIGAFIVNKDTRSYVKDCFHALTLPWSYLPTDEQILKYRRCFGAHYDSEALQLYDMAVSIHKQTKGWLTENCDHHYELGSSVQFTDKNNGTRYFEYGIFGAETDFAWSDGHFAKLYLDIDNNKICGQTLKMMIKLQRILGDGQTIRITCNGEELFEEYLEGGGEQKISFAIPERCIAENRLELQFEYPDACSPAEKGINDDERILAVAYSEFTIELTDG